MTYEIWELGRMASTRASRGRRIGAALLWTVTILETLGMGMAGFIKFANPEMWTGLFEGWGYPAWFTFVIGAAEIAGAVLVLVPRLATYAATMLTVIMLGALSTVIINSSELSVTGPIIHLALLAIIGTSRRSRRWQPNTTTAATAPPPG